MKSKTLVHVFCLFVLMLCIDESVLPVSQCLPVNGRGQ